VTDAEAVFRNQLQHYVAQGYEVIEVDNQNRRARMRIRVNLALAPGSRVIAAKPGYRYTCRVLAIEDNGTVRDEETPC